MTHKGRFEEAILIQKLKARAKDLIDKINNMKAVSAAHQKLNGELRKEVDDLKKDMMLLKNNINEKDLEIDRMMKKLTQKDT